MSKAKKGIIFIDDDPAFNFISSYAIKKLYPETEIQTFTEPTEALDNISNHKDDTPTVVFLDINMPELTGWDVLDRLSLLDKKILDSLKVYILSSSIDPCDRNRAEAHPLVKAYIQKPLLKPTINEILETK